MGIIQIIDLVVCGVFLIISLVLAILGTMHQWEGKEDEIHRHDNR